MSKSFIMKGIIILSQHHDGNATEDTSCLLLISSIIKLSAF